MRQWSPQISAKIYQAEEHLMNCNLAIRRNGRIRAVVGVFHTKVSIDGLILKTVGIVGVSSHPYEKVHGQMRPAYTVTSRRRICFRA